jgi:hypothetical protein
MTAEILKIVVELGVGGFSLYMFYRIITKMMEDHRAEREVDSKAWREEIREGRQASALVMKDLSDVIREVNRTK